jgi:hypothetical protein
MSNEEAGAEVQRAMLACLGPGSAEQLAMAQARLAWQETVAEAGLDAGGMRSRLVDVVNGIAQIDASEPILAQELGLRREALLHTVNRRMRGRPGATIELRGLAISVRRRGPGVTL